VGPFGDSTHDTGHSQFVRRVSPVSIWRGNAKENREMIGTSRSEPTSNRRPQTYANS
jgi:hypothetical protein